MNSILPINLLTDLCPRNTSGKLKKKIHKNEGKELRNEPSKERRFGQELRHLEKVVREAYLNPGGFRFTPSYCNVFTTDIKVQIPWDIVDFYEECVLKGRDKRRVRYPNPNLGAMSKPCVLIDIRGRIVFWYLPGLLSKKQKV